MACIQNKFVILNFETWINSHNLLKCTMDSNNAITHWHLTGFYIAQQQTINLSAATKNNSTNDQKFYSGGIKIDTIHKSVKRT